LWFTEYEGGGGVGRVTPTGTVTEFSEGINRRHRNPSEIAAGPDGNLWFTELGGAIGEDAIGRITPSGTVTEFTERITGSPFGITAGPDGNLWFTEHTASRIALVRLS
jgi:streptogramin lyase